MVGVCVVAQSLLVKISVPITHELRQKYNLTNGSFYLHIHAGAMKRMKIFSSLRLYNLSSMYIKCKLNF